MVMVLDGTGEMESQDENRTGTPNSLIGREPFWTATGCICSFVWVNKEKQTVIILVAELWEFGCYCSKICLMLTNWGVEPTLDKEDLKSQDYWRLGQKSSQLWFQRQSKKHETIIALKIVSFWRGGGVIWRKLTKKSLQIHKSHKIQYSEK